MTYALSDEPGADECILLHWYQMIIAAGGNQSGQVYIRAHFYTRSARDDFKGSVLVCDSDPHVALCDEPLQKWQGHNRLLGDCGPWAHVTDSMMIHDMFVSAMTPYATKVSIILADYTHEHGNYDYLTITRSAVFSHIRPRKTSVASPVVSCAGGDNCFFARLLKKRAAVAGSVVIALLSEMAIGSVLEPHALSF